MFNENNIINQMLKDENIEEKKNWIGYMNQIYNIYINGLNNETDSYKNMENEKLLKEHIFKASDFSFKIKEDKTLEIGHCMRETFFRFVNAISDPIENKTIEEIEKNELYKEQFKRKLRLLSLIDEDTNKIIESHGIKIETTEDAIIYDYEKQKEYLLFIKPVNDSTTTIKNKLFSTFSKPVPLNYHLPEILLNMFLYRKPAKIIYIGKNNSDMISEFNFGLDNGFLTINGEKNENIKINYIIDEIKYFSYCIEENIVPYKIFTNENLYQDQVMDMNNFGIIESFEVDKLLNGKEYINFQCNNCKYKSLCINEN